MWGMLIDWLSHIMMNQPDHNGKRGAPYLLALWRLTEWPDLPRCANHDEPLVNAAYFACLVYPKCVLLVSFFVS
jgi:hypothetical protein